MREIKFRAWDILEKRMRKVVSLHWQGDKLVSAKLEGENEPIPIEGRLVIEQFTGLVAHDEEIWENDIVEITSTYHDYGLGALVYDDGGFGVMAYAQSTLEKFPNILTEWFEEIQEPVDSIHWKPKIGEKYLYINDYGDVGYETWDDDDVDNRLMATFASHGSYKGFAQDIECDCGLIDGPHFVKKCAGKRGGRISKRK